MMTDPVIVIADKDYECNASMFIKDCLSDIVPDLTYQQKRDVVKARANSWYIKAGEPMRKYMWCENEEPSVNENDWAECLEIPEMSDICNDLDLWP